MITLSMLSLGVVILLAAITVLSVVATQSPALRPATCGASIGFEPNAQSPADTLDLAAHAESTLAGDWHTIELHRLSDVENLLDSLEASHVNKTEVLFLSNDHFAVRWR